jgi:hypothetical protein
MVWFDCFYLHPSPSPGRAEAIYNGVDDLSCRQASTPAIKEADALRVNRVFANDAAGGCLFHW